MFVATVFGFHNFILLDFSENVKHVFKQRISTIRGIEMRLYHGNANIVNAPAIRMSDVYLDFGIGFYTTPSYEQAEQWARIKMQRIGSTVGYISVYDIDIDDARKELNVVELSTFDEKWLSFVINNRNKKGFSVIKDIHIGPIANDNIYRSIRLHETGASETNSATPKTNAEELHKQWVMHTRKALSYLKFVEAIEVRAESDGEPRRIVELKPYICADLVSMISEKKGISFEEAIAKLYASYLYKLLEDEKTHVWQYSTRMLYSLLEQEEKNGAIIFPDV